MAKRPDWDKVRRQSKVYNHSESFSMAIKRPKRSKRLRKLIRQAINNKRRARKHLHISRAFSPKPVVTSDSPTRWRQMFIHKNSDQSIVSTLLFKRSNRVWHCVETDHPEYDWIVRIRHLDQHSDHILRFLSERNLYRKWGDLLKDRPTTPGLHSSKPGNGSWAEAYPLKHASQSPDDNTAPLLNNNTPTQQHPSEVAFDDRTWLGLPRNGLTISSPLN